MNINEMFFNVDKVSVYNGIEYRVVYILDNDLLLVVNKDDLEKGKYPLETLVIPDED